MGGKKAKAAQVYNPNAPRKGPGIYSLDDLRERCEVEEETGCWVWQMSSCVTIGSSRMVPRLYASAGVFGPEREVMSGPRAAWLMSGGRPLTGKKLVWRTCTNELCIAPDHLKAGTKKQWGRWVESSGALRGNPDMILSNRRTGKAKAIPKAVVEEIERRLGAGEKVAKVATETGINANTAYKIKRGVHSHQRPMRGSSVFSMGL